MTISTILVEDKAAIRDALIPALAEMAAIEVIAIAETAADAIAVLKKPPVPWQLAVIDLSLREGSGISVVEALRQRNEDQKVVVLTNFTNVDVHMHCIRSGANAVFDKSTDLEKFFEYCAVTF